MRLVADGYEFDFANAIALYKFDEQNKNELYYHGLSYCMKAVDIVAEFPNFQLWVEIKDYPKLKLDEIRSEKREENGKTITGVIQKALIQKFRDTFLYRLCEGCKKKVIYVCLTNFDNAECEVFKKELKHMIPTGVKGPRWSSELISPEHCFVVDINAWNRNFDTKFGTCTKVS